MAEQILGLFCDPPIVIARLGGSTTPLDCCVWEEPPNPRSDGATVLVPDWSLNVLPDGSVEPLKPDAIRFRDGPLIRPVCPFIEIWARLGEPGSDPSTWRDAPLTPSLLATAGLDPSALAAFRISRGIIFTSLKKGTFRPMEMPKTSVFRRMHRKASRQIPCPSRARGGEKCR